MFAPPFGGGRVAVRRLPHYMLRGADIDAPMHRSAQLLVFITRFNAMADTPLDSAIYAGVSGAVAPQWRRSDAYARHRRTRPALQAHRLDGRTLERGRRSYPRGRQGDRHVRAPGRQRKGRGLRGIEVRRSPLSRVDVQRYPQRQPNPRKPLIQ